MNLHHTDKPWITPSIKQLIKDRKKAFYRGDKQQWQLLKCKVQSEIKHRKEFFYKDKIQHLRKDDCRKWWNAVNKMSGKSRKNTSFSLDRDGKTLSDSELVNSLNSFYTSVNADIPQWRNYYGLRPGGPQPQWAKWGPPGPLICYNVVF